MSKPDPESFARSMKLTPAQLAEAFRTRLDASKSAKRSDSIARVLREELRVAEERARVLGDLDRPLDPVPIKGTPSKGIGQACPVFLASDWHVEERVDSAQVNGLNVYTPEIASKRAAQFFESIVWMIEKERHKTIVNEAVLWLGGDLLTGYIHEELKEANWLSPTEAMLMLRDIIVAGILYVVKRARLKVLHVPTNYGNHGRTTPKRMISTGAKNSFEWLLYRILAKHFEGDSRVRFSVSDGLLLYLDVFDKTLRFTHGDAVSYQGGVGGLTVPLIKKIYRWDVARRADLTLLGHFHTMFDGGSFLVNGSLIGPNAYGMEIGAVDAPVQAMTLIRPVRGKCGTAPVFVT